MLLFIVSTVCCIFSSTIESFIFFRLIQGVAGAGGIVVSRSIATDLFTGRELAKAMAIIGAINGVAPVASPVLWWIPHRLDWLERYLRRTAGHRGTAPVGQSSFQGVVADRASQTR